VIGILSPGIWRLPNLSSLLNSEVRKVGWPVLTHHTELTAIAGWGYRPTTQKARSYASRHGLPFITIEDGFLRSVGLGRNDPPLSIVIDDTGIYYNATQPSRLEKLIIATLSDTAGNRARKIIQAWKETRISKYNHQQDYVGILPERYVLVADQTFGDASIHYGLANADSFKHMLDAALSENPDCTILVKVHPDVLAGYKQGHFDINALSGMPRVRVLAEDAHPASLIEYADALYVVTSQIGFEGLLWGKRVRTFGMPFYAGWGLTEDALPAPDRRVPVSLENLVHATLVDYPRYIDPETELPCEVERLIEWMGLQKKMRGRFQHKLHAINFSRWKKPLVRDFLQGSVINFCKKTQDVHDDTPCVIWGMKDRASPQQALPEDFSTFANPILRLEDGFLRSVGLGADLIRPISWVVDTKGIYYDSSRPSDLEEILQYHLFDGEILTRAKNLRQRIVSEGLTKYNVGHQSWKQPELITGENASLKKKIILVPGQVESDASITFGAPKIRTNMDLLRAVRNANPDDYIVYKPHPDVVSGLRKSGINEGHASDWCDEIVVNVSINQLLNMVDEVHVLTSLAGFEGLLRQKKVVTYGQPFYAGWGLTHDISPVQRRTRHLNLDELIAGTLILYPTYISRKTRKYPTPERALDELIEWRNKGVSTMPLWRKLLRVVLRLVAKNK
jgi:capsular polysaccharide export protein